jgi:hypothetical protein
MKLLKRLGKFIALPRADVVPRHERFIPTDAGNDQASEQFYAVPIIANVEIELACCAADREGLQ